MDGDLSLSQSFGGLRIANPDDSDHADSSPTPPTSTPPAAATPVSATPPPPDRLPSPPPHQPEYQEQPPPPLQPLSRPVSISITGPQQPPAASAAESSLSSSTAAAAASRSRSGSARSSDLRDQSLARVAVLRSSSVAVPTPAPPRAPSPRHSQPPPPPPPPPQLQEQQQQQQQQQPHPSHSLPRDLSYPSRTQLSCAEAEERATRALHRSCGSALQCGVDSNDGTYSDRYLPSSSAASAGVPRQSSRASARQSAPVGGSNGGGGGASSGGGGGGGGDSYPPPSSSVPDWHDRGAAVGVRKEVDANGNAVQRYVKKGVRDFSFGRTLGEGSYSTVVAAVDRQTLKEYAIKILDKRHIIKEKKVKYVNIEKDTLNRLTDHPGVVRLYYTFQDERSLYFVLDLANGGELLGVLKRTGTFDLECCRFYGAQILDTIDYMHRRNVIHRDLKPENVLLDSQMHVKITDFGTAKMLDPPAIDAATGLPLSRPDDRASSFVGTAEYVSPELLTDKNACKASDLWAFGCIIFQLLAGRPPFKAANEYLTFQKIVALQYDFPPGFPLVARDLVERLLVLDPARRLPVEHIKNHEFFAGVAWGRGLWKLKAPRLRPYTPPPSEPIKLNGGGAPAINHPHHPHQQQQQQHQQQYPPWPDQRDPAEGGPPPSSGTSVATGDRAGGGRSPGRSLLRLTELPAPSQVDVEWSPVLTHADERVLKLGNLSVSHSSSDHHRNGTADGGDPHYHYHSSSKFARFFGSSGMSRRRHRLVLVTSAGRVLLAAAGGEEKKVKAEISLVGPAVSWRAVTNLKGQSLWVIDTREKHYVFDDSGKDKGGPMSSGSATEWTEALDRAHALAVMHARESGSPAAHMFDDPIGSELSSSANTLDRHYSHGRGPFPGAGEYRDYHEYAADAVSISGGTGSGSGPGSSHGALGVGMGTGAGGSGGGPGGAGGSGGGSAGGPPGGLAVHAGMNNSRNMLVKHGAGAPGSGSDADSTKGRKRFSRRQSRNGLSAVF